MKHRRLKTQAADLRVPEAGTGPVARAPIAILLAVSVAVPSSALGQEVTLSPSTAASGTGPATGSGTSPVMTPSERNAVIALEREGYTQVRDVKSGPEGISAKAVKDGKEVSVVVDSSGKVKQR